MLHLQHILVFGKSEKLIMADCSFTRLCIVYRWKMFFSKKRLSRVKVEGFSILLVLFNPSWWHAFISLHPAAFVLYSGMSLSFLRLFMFHLSLHLPQCLFTNSGACGLCWKAAGAVLLISAGGPEAQVGSSQRVKEEGWATHLLLLTATSWLSFWTSFILQPHALVSAVGWHWVQSYICSPSCSVVPFPSLLTAAMWDINLFYYCAFAETRPLWHLCNRVWPGGRGVCSAAQRWCPQKEGDCPRCHTAWPGCCKCSPPGT